MRMDQGTERKKIIFSTIMKMRKLGIYTEKMQLNSYLITYTESIIG